MTIRIDPPHPLTVAAPPGDAAGLEHLRRAVRGRATLPGEASWDAARQAWNLAVDQHPAAVIDAADVDDVQTTVRFAARAGLRVAMQGTGHGAATLPPLHDAILVHTGAMDAIDVDPARRVARVGAGVLAGDLVSAAAAHGLAFTAGSSRDVGVVGYTLGGGLGWLGRQHGLACNQVVAAEVVTAGGDVLRVDADHDAELFWALRGGGGSFAAVTALEVALLPIEDVHAGLLRWPLDRAAEVLDAWRVWCEEVPDTVTSVARILRYPPLPQLPDELRGGSFVAIEATFLDDDATAERWLRPLRTLGPAVDTFATVPVEALGELHGDPDQPVPALSDHRLVRGLTAETLDALLGLVGPGQRSPLLSVDLRQLGGALARSAPTHGVLDRLDADHAVFAVGIPVDDEVAAALVAQFTALGAALEPWDAGTSYLNFADQPTDPSRLFGTDRFARLREVKATYDRDDRFLANHPIR
jgi:hypothetical protein